ALARGRTLGPSARVLYVAAAWTAVEWLRAHLPYGIPWALLGTAVDPASAPAQVADLGGVYLVSFVLALPSAALAELVRRGRAARAAAAVAVVLVVAAALYGGARRTVIARTAAAAPSLRIAIAHAEL